MDNNAVSLNEIELPDRLTANQQKAMRLVTLVYRRPPTPAEMERIRDRGDNYPLFRLSFLLNQLSGDRRATVEEQFTTFVRIRNDGQERSRVAHDLEVLRLSMYEMQRAVDDLQSDIIDLLRHAEKVNSTFERYSALQGRLLELGHRLDRCALCCDGSSGLGS